MSKHGGYSGKAGSSKVSKDANGEAEMTVVMCSGVDFDLCGFCEKIHGGQLHLCPRTWVAPVAVGEASETSPDNSILLPITQTNRLKDDV